MSTEWLERALQICAVCTDSMNSKALCDFNRSHALLPVLTSIRRARMQQHVVEWRTLLGQCRV